MEDDEEEKEEEVVDTIINVYIRDKSFKVSRFISFAILQKIHISYDLSNIPLEWNF